MTIAPEDFAPYGNGAAPRAAAAPLPPNEAARLQALRDYAILDTAPERAFDRITRLAATVFDVPIAMVSLVDAERQWFKSSVGLDVCETQRDGSFCAHAILTDAVMIVPDASEDPRFAANPLVTGAPHIRFYAGAPLRTASGFHLGTLCIIDRVPREFGAAQAAMLADFAAIVSEAMEERLARAELLESKFFLQSSLDALSAHIALLDATGTIVAVNATWSRFAEANGGSGESFGIGVSYLEVCEQSTGNCSAEATVVATGIRRVMAREVAEFEHIYPCHSPQEERWFVVRVTRFQSSGTLFMVVAHENVTARTQAERKLRMQQAELRVLFDFLPAMICFKDTENRFLRANRLLAESVGKTMSEIEGKTAAEIFPQEADKFFADDLEVISSGVPKLGIIESFRNAAGREFWVETDKAPVFDHEGTVIGIIVMSQDVTERRLAEQELRWKTALLEAQMNASLDGILVVSGEGRTLLQNSQTAGLLKIPRHLAEDGNDEEQVRWFAESTADPVQFVERVTYLYQHPHEVGRDEIHLKDGTVLDRYSAPVSGRDGSYYGRIWTFRDMTERKRAEAEVASMHQQLVVASRQAGMAEVATGVLHNVGNVLNSVNVSSTLVAETVRRSKIGNLQRVVALLDTHAADLGAFVSSDPQGKNLAGYLRQLHERFQQEQKTVLAEVEELQKNIDHIKDIVAMQQSYATFAGVTEVVELSDLVEDALRMNESSLHRHDVQVVREFEEIPRVSVDRHKMLQILVNLVRNAKQACDDAGCAEKRLTFRVTNGHEHVRVAVTDNGVGIAPENLTRIFEHGFTTKKNGHGFGLHSSALAAKECGGTLRVHSDGPGRGATFTLELPLPEGLSRG